MSLHALFVIVLFRVATPLPYFISELLYVPRNELENTHTIPLHVITVNPSNLRYRAHCSVLSPADDTRTSDPCTRQELHTSEKVNTRVRDTETLLPLTGEDCHSAAAQSSSASDTKHELSAPPHKKQKTDCCSHSEDRAPTLSAEGANTGTLTSEGDGVCSVSGIPILDFCFPAEVTRQLEAVIGDSTAWILDIDLDFFSTGNPFKSLFTEVSIGVEHWTAWLRLNCSVLACFTPPVHKIVIYLFWKYVIDLVALPIAVLLLGRAGSVHIFAECLFPYCTDRSNFLRGRS